MSQDRRDVVAAVLATVAFWLGTLCLASSFAFGYLLGR